MSQLNENGIAVITPPFKDNDDCACFYRGQMVLEIHTISSDLA